MAFLIEDVVYTFLGDNGLLWKASRNVSFIELPMPLIFNHFTASAGYLNFTASAGYLKDKFGLTATHENTFN